MSSNFMTRLSPLVLRVTYLILLCGFAAVLQPLQAQSFSSLDRERVRGMLNVIKGDIKKNYYDPSFHGIDLDTRFKAAEEKIKAIDSLSQAYGVIAQVLSEFNDSHLYFVPPPRPAHPNYGWRMQMIGDECLVSAVQPGSDAEAKGLKPGDRILKVDGFTPTRDNVWKMEYRYNLLRPQAGIQVVAQTGSDAPRELDLKAKIIQGKRKLDFTGDSGVEDIEAVLRASNEEDRVNRHRYIDNLDAFFWKMPQFDLANNQIDDLMNKAAKHKALILDLRGNGGGDVETLKRLIGNLFDHDIKIDEVKRRKETKPTIAKTRGKDAYQGKLIVLIDSRSGSCSEILARVVQLEKRGVVIGDQTAGAVMQSQFYRYEMGANAILAYGAMITDADVIMGDGKSLEHSGVAPDELLLPTGADLAALRDPVLARAAELAGMKIDAERAGSMFPIEWKRE